MARRILIALEFGWVAYFAVLVSDGGGSIIDGCVFFLGSAALAVVWLVRAAVALRAARERRLRLASALREPAIVVCAIALAYTAAPFCVRVLLSQPGLRSYVEECRRTGVAPENPRWVGLLKVHRTDFAGSAIRMITARVGMSDHAGLVYSPDGPPPVLGEDV